MVAPTCVVIEQGLTRILAAPDDYRACALLFMSFQTLSLFLLSVSKHMEEEVHRRIVNVLLECEMKVVSLGMGV